MRRHLLSRFLRPAGVSLLTVRRELDIEVIALELHALEVTEPRDDFELEKIRGDELVVRLGKEGEAYTGIRKEKVNVAGRICIADAEGPCGNPSADSARTMITTDTERAAWIYFLPVTDEEVDRTAELIAVFGRGLVRMATVPA